MHIWMKLHNGVQYPSQISKKQSILLSRYTAPMWLLVSPKVTLINCYFKNGFSFANKFRNAFGCKQVYLGDANVYNIIIIRVPSESSESQEKGWG